ncbi:MAG: dihydroorotase [Phycisphaerales bacterium]|nr:dihydroorotase [Phycisphaerales bacterium]
MPPPILIKNARVIDPASGIDRVADVALRDGRVADIGESPSFDDPIIVDAEGLIACPGLIDPHVHLREPGQEHKETVLSGSMAAAAGGFTTVCCMPNTSPTLDSPEVLSFLAERAQDARCRVFPVAAATVGREGQLPSEIALLARAGAVAFSDDGDAIASAGVMRQVLGLVRDTGRAFMQHCQEPTLTHGAAMNAGEIATTLGLGGWPAIAEELIIERDIRLNTGIGCRYHVQHISAAGSVDLVRKARGRGLPVTAEASPHHLLLTDEACLGFDTMAKVNPPLRSMADVEAVRAGVADGTITVLATDHAPHAAHEKDADFASAPFGMIGLETAVALYHQALVETGILDWPRLISMMTVAPAALCNLDRMGLGKLVVGGPADVTLIDPKSSWTISTDDFAGKSANSPFIGREVGVRPVATIVGGELHAGRLGERVKEPAPG